MENPIDAAIDRAYVDMASHTLKGFAEHQYQEKWELRFEASSKIKEALGLLDAESDYTSWHCELCGKLQKVYTEKRLSYGQAQKWVNMTTKYLQVFAVIFKSIDDDEGLSKIPEFFWNAANIKKLHIPFLLRTMRTKRNKMAILGHREFSSRCPLFISPALIDSLSGGETNER